MPVPSYLDQSKPDAGEADKDMHSIGAGPARYEAAEARKGYIRVKGMAKGAVKAAGVGSAAKRLLSLLKGTNVKPLMAKGQAAHIASLVPGSKMTPADVNAAYGPYREEVAKMLAAYAGVGGAGYGAWRLAKPEPEPSFPQMLKRDLLG